VARSITFDREGNVWSAGPTLAEAMLNRTPASAFAASGTAEPDRELDLAGVGCIPAIGRLAFDPSRNLWVTSPCLNQVVFVAYEDLSRSGDVAVSVTLDVPDPAGLAFDATGNLWVSSGTRVVRFDRTTLGASRTEPDASVSLKRADGADLAASALAFDADGDLWAIDFGGNAVYEIPASALVGAGASEVTVTIVLAIEVTALLEDLAFDEDGGLWITYSAGKVARLAPLQARHEHDARRADDPRAHRRERRPRRGRRPRLLPRAGRPAVVPRAVSPRLRSATPQRCSRGSDSSLRTVEASGRRPDLTPGG
jgi:hypothetical protein